MSEQDNPLEMKKDASSPVRMRMPEERKADDVHVLSKGRRCDTDTRGYARPRNRDPRKIVVDASEGFIPLWASNTSLRWRFRETSMEVFEDPGAAKAAIEGLLADAILAWGDAAPVKFVKRTDAWDFEIVMRARKDCDANGCVLASAFFPDAGRHQLEIYPSMFEQSATEQVETLAHEIGHVFGLRHFFANVSEAAFPSVIFGEHKPFSIMNYGAESQLTDADRSDLKRLYQLARSGELTKIGSSPIRLVKPFHTLGE